MFEKGNTTSISITTDTMVRTVLVALGVFLLWYLRDLVFVVLTSIVIASFVEAAVPHFRKIRINRVFGIVILYASSISILALIFYLFAPLLVTEIYNFSTFIGTYIPGVSFLNYFNNASRNTFISYGSLNFCILYINNTDNRFSKKSRFIFVKSTGYLSWIFHRFADNQVPGRIISKLLK